LEAGFADVPDSVWRRARASGGIVMKNRSYTVRLTDSNNLLEPEKTQHIFLVS
jgi:hypothetical protein